MKKDITQKIDAFVSIVIFPENFDDTDPQLIVQSLYDVLSTSYNDHEIVIVGCALSGSTRIQMETVLNTVPAVRVIELSYPSDPDDALTVGLENSIGDFVVLFNPHQDQIDVVKPIIEVCRNKFDVVTGVASNWKKSLGYKAFRPVVNMILREIGYCIPQDATTLRCISRNTANSATQTRNYSQQLLVKISQRALDSEVFLYKIKNADKQVKTLFRAVKSALQLLVFNSTRPLRWVSSVGVLGSLCALIFATYSFLVKFISNEVAEGWTSIVIFMSVLFMLLFIILSIVGEYLSRLLLDQGKHANYWVLSEKYSSIKHDSQRHNVVKKP